MKTNLKLGFVALVASSLFVVACGKKTEETTTETTTTESTPVQETAPAAPAHEAAPAVAPAAPAQEAAPAAAPAAPAEQPKSN